MENLAKLSNLNACFCGNGTDTAQRTFGGIFRRRQAFMQGYAAIRCIEQNEIGECAANIEAKTVAQGGSCHWKPAFTR
jgi:hypothetical protein